MEKISQAQEKFNLLDLIPIGGCVIDSNLTVLFWNQCLEEWTKIPRSQILGTSICERFAHFNKPIYLNRLQQVFEGGPPTIFSSQLHKYVIPSPLPQGKYRIQHTTVTSVPAFDGEGFYALFSIQDVTDLTLQVQDYRAVRDRALAEAVERRRAQEVAEAANRVKDEFLAIVSHELRTPLSPILGWSKLLKAGKLDPEGRLRAIDTIERNAKQQVQLIDDLLDVSRILRGKLELKLATVDLASTIQAALETIRLAAEVKSIKIQLELNKDVGAVKGDANRLQQVICNLLSNAVKFTPPKGEIEISLEQVDGEAVLKVRDTGMGISPEFLPHIFEYFRQADSTTTRKFGGLGLGLGISRQLVEMHGGRIHAESLGSGKGATFTVILPTIANIFVQGQTQEKQIDDVRLLEGVKVLAVEDEPDNLEFLTFLLNHYGATVTAVNSGEAAFTAIASIKPDILVSDIGMPGMDGYDLMKSIRSLPASQGGSVKAIALTAYARSVDTEKIFAAGFQCHLTKPLNPIELIDTIVRLME